jgi:hypothetical protein
VHVHDHFYIMRKLRTPASVDGRRNDNVSPKVLPGPPLLALALEHLAEIDVRQNTVTLRPRVLAQVCVGTAPHPLP